MSAEVMKMKGLSESRLRVTDIHEIALVSSFKQYIATDVRSRPDYGLLYKVSGHVKYHIDGKIMDFSPGMVCYFPKGCSYRIERLEKGEAIRIAFDLFDDPGIDAFTELYKSSAALEMQFNKLVSLWRSTVQTFDYRVMAAMYELLEMMDVSARMNYVGTKSRAQIQAAAEFLGENFADPQLSIAALAEKAGMSASTFRSSFAKVYGMPPVRYLGLLRLNAAKSMLTATDRRVEEIAEAAGFSDQFYFSKCFKASCGVSPSEYRRRHLM